RTAWLHGRAIAANAAKPDANMPWVNHYLLIGGIASSIRNPRWEVDLTVSFAQSGIAPFWRSPRPRRLARPEVFVLLSKLVVALLAHRHVAGGQTDPVEGRLGEAKPLVHVGHDFDHLVD